MLKALGDAPRTACIGLPVELGYRQASDQFTGLFALAPQLNQVLLGGARECNVFCRAHATDFTLFLTTLAYSELLLSTGNPVFLFTCSACQRCRRLWSAISTS